ncbi:YcaO-like family protein [Streptomonospora alba]|nr:YcaO-like family protein [Streptomonospora alba]
MSAAADGPVEHACPTRDGMVLRGLLWRCASPTGLVLVRTPYDAGLHAPIARSWTERGYHCLVQDVRGRYRSGGDWSPYAHEGTDGRDILDRLLREFPNLPLLLFGASYAGHCALEAAREAVGDGTDAAPRSPSADAIAGIVVLVPALGLAETAWDADGRPQLRHRIGWWHQHGRGRCAQPALSGAELDRRTARARERGPIAAAADWGWPPEALTGWQRLWSAQRIDPRARYGPVEYPLLAVGGDDDFFREDTARLARDWPGPSHLVSGPWGHGLVSGIPDDDLRARVRSAGGVGGIIDAWLGIHTARGSPPPWTAALPPTPGSRSRSVFDPAAATWHHERSAPMTAPTSAPRPPHAGDAAPEQDAPADPLPAEALVDPECGIIRSVRPVPRPEGAPPSYLALTAAVADARRLGEWPADRVSLGTSFADADQARIAAIAEGVERYCGNWLPAELPPEEFRVATAGELREESEPVLDTARLPRFAPWQYTRQGFPYTPLTDDTPTLWTRCADLDGHPAWLPDALVHLNWRQSRFRHLARTHHLNYAGIATGQGADDARDRGVLEVVERDALELWWHLDGPTFGIDPASVPGLEDDLQGGALSAFLVAMPSELAPAVAALVHDRERGLYAAGFSAALDPVRAARKAVLEAVHTWVYTQGCTTADGWVFRAVEQGLMARGLYLDFREDGSYLDSAGEHCRNIVDLGAHVQLWLDPRLHAQARRFTEPALGLRPITRIPAVSMEEVYRRLARRGHRVLTRDLTTADVGRTPLRVVRTFITGLVPNAPAAFAYLGMARFEEAARARGWRASWTGNPEDFTLVPPPHM